VIAIEAVRERILVMPEPQNMLNGDIGQFRIVLKELPVVLHQDAGFANQPE
jgi:hypothetical protein